VKLDETLRGRIRRRLFQDLLRDVDSRYFFWSESAEALARLGPDPEAAKEWIAGMPTEPEDSDNEDWQFVAALLDGPEGLGTLWRSPHPRLRSLAARMLILLARDDRPSAGVDMDARNWIESHLAQ
jgi:hypothetical protein